MTIGDVAAQAGVSVATVSKVINDRYGVAEDTSARVRAVIEELGYEASLVAQSLRSRRTNVIGMLVADIEPFSAELLKGAARAVARHRLRARRVLRLRPRERPGSAGSAATCRASAARSPTGRSSSPRQRRRRVRRRRWSRSTTTSASSEPADRRLRQPRTARSPRPSTCSASVTGASGSSAGRPDLESARLRERGYRQALADAGIAVDEGLIRVGGYEPETRRRSGARAARARPAADGDLRRQRRRQRSRPSAVARSLGLASRGPVGHRVRQRPRVGARRARR